MCLEIKSSGCQGDEGNVSLLHVKDVGSLNRNVLLEVNGSRVSGFILKWATISRRYSVLLDCDGSLLILKTDMVVS